MDLWDDLIEYIKDGKVVPVIGPELLQIEIDGRKVLLYQHIAEVLAAEVGIAPAELTDSFTINDVVCKYLQSGKPASTIYRRIHGILDKTPATIPDPLRKLANIRPLKLFVTTTFDALMEKALNTQRFGGSSRTMTRYYAPNKVRDEADLPTNYMAVPEPFVFQLFGKGSTTPDHVVTEEDTLEFITSLQSRDRRPNRLFDELKSNHLLFIGNTFSDWLARFFVRLTRGERFLGGGGYMMQYMSDLHVSKDRDFIYFVHSFGRNQVEIVSDCGPVEFVDQLVERFREKYPNDYIEDLDSGTTPPPPITDEPDSVFLSYAREDSAAAMLITETLEKAGITVWLDRARIRHGDEWSDKILYNIRRCSIFFPLLSHNTDNRRVGVFYEEWKCAEEIARRIKPGEVFIVPIPIDDSTVPPQLGTKHYEVFPEGRLTPEFVAWIQQVLAKIKDRDKDLVDA